MNNILVVKNLQQKYSDSEFTLSDVSFSIPSGSIMGLVGENGAGKTTTISAILNTLFKDGGSVEIFGKEMTDTSFDIRENIGVVFDAVNFSESLTAIQLNNVMKHLYKQWDNHQYLKLLHTFNLPTKKKIKTFSKGMAMKLALSVALSHHPKLLILDEATSGLDPIVRDEILDIFLDFVGDETHSILLSSHITSDLEKIADYITFIHDGATILTAKKDDLLYNYGIIRCKVSDFDKVNTNDILSYYRRDYQIDILVQDKELAKNKYPNMLIDNVTLDEIMLLLVKGVR